MITAVTSLNSEYVIFSGRNVLMTLIMIGTGIAVLKVYNWWTSKNR